VPVCATAIILGIFFVPDSRDPEEGRLDPLGAVLSIIGLSGLLYGIIEAPDKGWGSPNVLMGFLIAAIFIGGFFAWELHTPHPMLDIRFFRNPRFTAASATITLTYFALFGSTFLLTQYFQFVLGYSPLKAGLMTAPVAVGIMVCAPQAPKAVDRFGTKKVVAGGLLVVAAALFLYTSDTIMSSVVLGAFVRVLFGAGMGFTVAPATESIMGSLPPAKAGVGSAVNDTTRQTGGALGVAVIGSVFAARFHSVVGSASQVPESARGAVRDSIGAALDAARNLPASEQAVIRGVVDHAYIVSMRLAYSIAAIVILLAATVTWRYLPAHAPDEGEEELEAEEPTAEAVPVTTG
jgi:MFS family permease